MKHQKIILLKNKEKAPYFGSRYGQDVEPSGYYASEIKKISPDLFERNDKYEIKYFYPKNPLIIPVTDQTLVSWKYDLYNKYQAKHKSLTNKLLKEGYDSIITEYSNGDTGEIIVFDTENLLDNELENSEVLDGGYENLSYLISEYVQQIGEEKKQKHKKINDNLELELYISEFGSYRFLLRHNKVIVSAIQVMSRNGKTGYVANAFTKEEFRRKGYGRMLVNYIRNYFDDVDFSEDRSSLGKVFFKNFADDGKIIETNIKLIKKSVLNDFQSGSSLDFYDNKIFVVGDDTKDLLIINSDFEELNRVRLFESADRRIAKDLKADLETSTIINHNDTPSILMLGSGARDNKSFGYIVPFDTLKVTEPFKYDVFINRLKNEHGIEKVNIEGSASLEDDFILSNRGNKNNPDNFLIITENNFWENQSTVKISLSRLLLPNKDAGISEIYYETDSDTLFFTASVEQTTNNYDDGEIGDSFIGYISSFSNKLSENTITPDLFINLTEIDSSFDKHKIEGICIENKSYEYYTINLVSDNDNDESTIFKIELKKQNIVAADGKKIPERYRNMGFTKVGQKKKSTIPEKKWMVLARKGDKYKVVHGGYKGMQDYSQHHDDVRRKRFWNRMGGFDSEKSNDPFSPLYWHKKFGTWEDGGPIEENSDIPVMDEETYLAINGAPSGFGDPALHKNRGGASDKAWTKIVDRQAAKDRELMAKREVLRQEYKEKVEKGEIRPPSRNEKLISIAQGHPDLESTQAARRILQKKGVNWE